MEALFGSVTFVEAEGVKNEVGFVTGVMKEADFEAKKEQLAEVLSVIRVTD